MPLKFKKNHFVVDDQNDNFGDAVVNVAGNSSFKEIKKVKNNSATVDFTPENIYF